MPSTMDLLYRRTRCMQVITRNGSSPPYLARSPSSCAMIPAPIAAAKNTEGVLARPGRQRFCCCCWCLRCNLDDAPNEYTPPLPPAAAPDTFDTNDSQLLKGDRWFHEYSRGHNWNAKAAPVVTAGTRSTSIDDCHGQGPRERARLEGPLNGVFIMMAQAVRGCVGAFRTRGAREANIKIGFYKISWRCFLWEPGDSRIGDGIHLLVCGGTSLPVNRYQVGGVTAPFLPHVSHGGDACRLRLPPGRPIEKRCCSKGAVVFAGGYLCC